MILKYAVGSKCLLHGALKLNAIIAISSQLEEHSHLSKLRIDHGTFTFLLASTCTSVAPRSFTLDPRIEGLAWTFFLQSALVLGLWAADSLSSKPRKRENVRQWISILAVFLIGTVGSAIGGYLGFHVAKSASGVGAAKFPSDALTVLSACLTASYIGGTVNFFETAKILGAVTCEAKKSLLNLVAGADIGVMILYFWLLTTIRSSPIKRLFPSRTDETPILVSNEFRLSPSSIAESTGLQSESSPFEDEIPLETKSVSVFDYLPSVTAAGSVILLANFIQRKLNIPGISVMFATLAAVGFMDAAQNTQTTLKSTYIEDDGRDSRDDVTVIPRNTSDEARSPALIKHIRRGLQILLLSIKNHSAGASKYMMGLFYAAVGFGFRFDQISTIGRPISALIAVTLSCHLCVLLSGSMLWNKCVGLVSSTSVPSSSADIGGNRNRVIDGKRADYLIHLDTALIASNACVGGAATAAQMASTMPQRTGGVNLMVAASSMGTLGYLIGTPIGLHLARILSR